VCKSCILTTKPRLLLLLALKCLNNNAAGVATYFDQGCPRYLLIFLLYYHTTGHRRHRPTVTWCSSFWERKLKGDTIINELQFLRGDMQCTIDPHQYKLMIVHWENEWISFVCPRSLGSIRGHGRFLRDFPWQTTLLSQHSRKWLNSPQWHHTTCGHWGGRPKSNHGQTMAEKNTNDNRKEKVCNT